MFSRFNIVYSVQPLFYSIAMIRYEGFDGFFIMKKDPEGKWEYLSKYSRRGGNVFCTFSESEARYFSDNTIKTELVWKVFDSLRAEMPDSKLIIYVSIDKKISRVKYYNPEGEKKITTWQTPLDFQCFIPQRGLR